MKPDYAFWQHEDEFELQDVAFLCCDREPEPWRSADSDCRKLEAMARRLKAEVPHRDTTRHGTRPSYGGGVLDVTVPGPCFFKRDDLIEWAEKTGRKCTLPFLFPEYREAAQTESVNSEPPKRRERTGTTRSDALDGAIKAARAALLKRHGCEPSAEAVCVHLEDDPTGVVVDHTDTALTWGDARGNLHDTARKTVANRLTRIRKQD